MFFSFKRLKNMFKTIFSALATSAQVSTLKGQSHEIFDLWFFFFNCTPGSPDSWAKAVSNIDSYLRSYSTTKIESALCNTARTFLLDNRQLSILLYCHGVSKIICGCFLLYCFFNGRYKSRNIGVWLRTVQKKKTPHYVTLQHFSQGHMLCTTEWSRLRVIFIVRSHIYLWLSLRKLFNPLISDPNGIDWWKKPGVNNFVRLSLYGPCSTKGSKIIFLQYRGLWVPISKDAEFYVDFKNVNLA
jgi:hypothetical protein